MERATISAKVIADSLYQGSRLTTFEATFPRFILAEFNTHRVFSRNSASSRAIPVWKQLRQVLEYPFVPMAFGKNRPGMQADEMLTEEDQESARHNWLIARDIAVMQAFTLVGGREQVLKDGKGGEEALRICYRVAELLDQYPDVSGRSRRMSTGVHKQHANRLLEPFAYHTVILTSAYLRNFYALRASSMAQPEIQDLAIAMATAHSESTPTKLKDGEWHLPFIFDEDRSEVSGIVLARVSSARCARVSYLTHDGTRDIKADLALAQRLQGAGHTSPFEHPAKARSTNLRERSLGGNFGRKWKQYRKTLPNESDFSRLTDREALLGGMKGDERLVDFVLSLPE